MNDKATPTSKDYWQSLSQLAETPAMQAQLSNTFAQQEFQNYDPAQMVNGSRRKFLKLAGASMALAGITLTGCRRWPKEEVVDQNSRPVGHTPGVPEKYATLFEICGTAQPLLVTTYDGRPIKIEGNPLHPLSSTFGGKYGASGIYAQASILEMYDPERSRTPVMRNGSVRQPMSWKAFTAYTAENIKGDGAGIAVLTESTLSPTFKNTVAAFQKKFPQAKVYEYEPISRDNELAASKLAFGQTGRWVYDLAKANIIVSFDSDLFAGHPNELKHTNDWAKGRRTVDTDKKMNRLYAIESRFTTTGVVADHRLPAGSRLIEQLVLQLAHKAGLESGQASLTSEQIKFIDQVWEDLEKNEGKAVVTGGQNLRPEVLAVIAAINDKIGALGKTVSIVPEADRPTHLEAITELSQRLTAGQVETLIILGGNPAYDAPADLGFDSAISKAKTSIHLSLYDNETSALCLWHVNRAHYLETWGDGEFWDGSIGVQQPMIEPLFGGKTPSELLAAITGDAISAQELLYRTWSSKLKKPFVANDEAFQKILHDGFIPGTPTAVKVAAVKPTAVSFDAAVEGYELRFVADAKVYDGRFANNGWLQETPDLISKITWDNAALISYADAQTLGVKQRNHEQDVLEIKLGDKVLEIPAYIVPGQPKGVITLPLGYARKIAGSILLTDRPGSIGAGVGYDTYKLRSSKNFWSAYGATAAKTGGTAIVASTATHQNIEPMGFDIRNDRVGTKFGPGDIVHESTLAEYLKEPEAPHEKSEKMHPLQLFPGPYLSKDAKPGVPDQFNIPHAWGMTIDMSTCTGCNACVVACQAENNIPVVGKDEVIMTRQMQWLRIDRYYKTDASKSYEEQLADDNPEITLQPMMCVHCENAPCEQVCPVAATVHDSEGLNTMVYNRCIGTRYCANNCPYKVRRFNFLDYQSRIPGEWRKPWLGIPDTQQEESIDKIKALVFNPDVSVRMRGVMEKCTYCVQRIKSAENSKRIEWLNKGAPTEPGENGLPQWAVDDLAIATACQQACAAEAIIFGNLNDKESLVYKTQEHERSYQVLQALNNRPRTHHLAKIRNPAGEEA